jgi:hypothetical protein
MAPACCATSEITAGDGVVGVVERGDVVSGVSDVGAGGEEGEAEVEAWVGGGGGDGAEAEVGALPPADVEPAWAPDVEEVCSDTASVVVDAPLSGAATAMVPARASTRRKSLLTRAPPSPSSWISQVSGPWLLA